jgi:hypothetical protein
MEASSAHAKAYLLMGGRFAGATATGTASSVLIVQLARAAGGDRLARLVTPSLDYCSTLDRLWFASRPCSTALYREHP